MSNMSANDSNTTATASDDSQTGTHQHKFPRPANAWEHLCMTDKALHHLLRIDVGDDPEAWADAGFNVVDGETRVGSTVIRLRGANEQRGIMSLAIDGITKPIDGLTVSPPIPGFHRRITPLHPNLVSGLDHVVALSPDIDRTVAALTEAGLDPRRTRHHESEGVIKRQVFFWLDDVILELTGDDPGHGPGPARWWGLAFTCQDLDESHASLAGLLGDPKAAVQPGRRISVLHTDEVDMSVPIVFMSPHPTHSRSDHPTGDRSE